MATQSRAVQPEPRGLGAQYGADCPASEDNCTQALPIMGVRYRLASGLYCSQARIGQIASYGNVPIVANSSGHWRGEQMRDKHYFVHFFNLLLARREGGTRSN